MTLPIYILLTTLLVLAATGTIRLAGLWCRGADTGRHCSGRHTYPWLRHRREQVAA
jgi:hypothetical protein